MGWMGESENRDHVNLYVPNLHVLNAGSPPPSHTHTLSPLAKTWQNYPFQDDILFKQSCVKILAINNGVQIFVYRSN